jgi:hypothetical protein
VATSLKEARKTETALIFERIKAKGWNVYGLEIGALCGDEAIEKNLVEHELELNKRYVILPRANDPRDPAQVKEKLEDVTERLSRRDPLTIMISGAKHSLTGFTLKANGVIVNTPRNCIVGYEEFLRAVESVVQIQD